ncbi:MAG: ester cyclase [Candidatus Bathyarchaeia archaeon]
MVGFTDPRFVYMPWCALEYMLAEGDKVAGRLSGTGTNLGEFMGIPATGKKVTISGISII